jgi:hypothetical protein
LARCSHCGSLFSTAKWLAVLNSEVARCSQQRSGSLFSPEIGSLYSPGPIRSQIGESSEPSSVNLKAPVDGNRSTIVQVDEVDVETLASADFKEASFRWLHRVLDFLRTAWSHA